ncbi:sigma-54 interaction domain-containing protein [Bacillus smithii]|uniref:sigma-54 interaction domain-containing protein n=1 Tax=Bacillus smithii TaxID=1479 RepID=UPI0022E78465|nr:sigma 54-interacting transcriptional regulator [Bacillus smithii]
MNLKSKNYVENNSAIIQEFVQSLPFASVLFDESKEVRLMNEAAMDIWKKDKRYFENVEMKRLVSKTIETNTPIQNQQIKINSERLIYHFSPMRSNNGVFYGVLVMVQPFTNSLEEFEAYKAESMDLKAIFDSSFDVLYVSDSQGNTIRVSSSCVKLWGKEEHELIGKNVKDLEKEGIYSPSVTRLVLEQGKKVHAIQTTKEGKRLLVVGTPIKNENGEIIRVVNASRDITEVSKLQEEINEMKRLLQGYKKELADLRQEKNDERKLISNSKVMDEILDLSRKVAAVDSTVLILGESGVGKEVIANFIHSLSLRKNKPFMKINCGAIPENLLESELFGYDRGAFTGAKKEGKMGLFELAHDGTLFLDEIAEMPISLQVKLLRVLQEQEVMRIGGRKPIKINVRILAATNKNLLEEVEKGNFREDLYYRLNVIPINIPPLRERREDILSLSLHFIEYYNQKYMRSKKLSNSAIEILQQYDWPGNVRELQNIMERLVVLTEHNTIKDSDLEGLFLPPKTNKGKVIVSDIIPLKDCVAEAENQLLELAKKKFKSTSEMAKALGVNQSTISRKLQRYKLSAKQ